MFSLFKSDIVLVDSSKTLLWIKELNMLVSWIQTVTLLVDQDLWIEVSVINCSYSKVASKRERVYENQERQ